MAERNLDTPIEEGDRIEFQINWVIDTHMELLNLRRIELVTQVRRKQEERKVAENARREKVRQLIEAQEQLQATLKDNSLSELRTKMLADIQAKIKVLRESIVTEQHLDWECNPTGLQECIATLGEIVERKGLTPNYAAFQCHTVVTWNQQNEKFLPFGVAIDDKTNQIFVADHIKTRIQIFSDRGVSLNSIGEEHLKCPWGVAIHQTSLFVCDWGHHALFKFSLLDLSLLKQVGMFGSGNGEFKWPRQLTVANNEVFVADCYNDRISIFDTDLIHLRNISHKGIMLYPSDVKVARELLYVLTEGKGLSMHIFTPQGEYIKSTIEIGDGRDVSATWFFCLDTQNNFVISDMGANNVKVLSPDGTLLHTIGQEGETGLLHESRGVAITLSGKLVCVSNAKNAALQIFY